MQTMLSAMPRDMQQDAARHLRHTLEHGLPPGAQAMLGEQAESTARLLSGMQAKLQEQEKEQHARIAIHHYRSEEHTSELQSHSDLVCRLLLEKKKKKKKNERRLKT